MPIRVRSRIPKQTGLNWAKVNSSSAYLQQHGPQRLFLLQTLTARGDVALLHIVVWRQKSCFLCQEERDSDRCRSLMLVTVTSGSKAVALLTLLPPFDLLDLVHGAPQDVALVRLGAQTGNVAHVGRHQLSQILDVAALQLPPPLLHSAANK